MYDDQVLKGPIQGQGLAILCDLLAQIEGLEWMAMDIGGAAIVFVQVADGIIGVTRGSSARDFESPDGWLAVHYTSFDELEEGRWVLDDGTFAQLLHLFTQFAPGSPPFPFPDQDD